MPTDYVDPNQVAAIYASMAAQANAAAATQQNAAIEAAAAARAAQPTINPANFANVPLSQIEGQYGYRAASDVSNYYKANPSPTFQSLNQQYVQQQQNTIGSGPAYRQPTDVPTGANPYDPNSAAGISWEVARTGGVSNPFVAANAKAEGYSNPIAVAKNPVTGGTDYGMSTVPVAVRSSGLPLFLASNGFNTSDTITTYVPYGSYAQTKLLNTKDVIDYNTGEIGIYQPEYSMGKLIGYGLTSSGSRNALQSGMFTFNLPETPYVTNQWDAGTYSLPTGTNMSRLGAEAYGGYVQPLTGQLLTPTSTFSQYPGNQYNFANLVNPQGPNLGKTAAPGVNLPWTISERSPALQYTTAEIIPTGPNTTRPGLQANEGLPGGVWFSGGIAQLKGGQGLPAEPSAFTAASNWFATTPILGSVFNLGASQSASTKQAVSDFTRTTPILSSIWQGGRVSELKGEYESYMTGISGQPVTVETANAGNAKLQAYQTASSDLLGGSNTTKFLTYGIGAALIGAGAAYNEAVTKPISGILGSSAPAQFIASSDNTGLVSAPGALATLLGQGIAGAGTIIGGGLTAVANLPGLEVAGLVMMGGSLYSASQKNPAGLAGSITGQVLIFEGAGKAYEVQPYRVGLQSAEISPAAGTGEATARYTSFGISKLTGADRQIEQIVSVPIGVGGKVTSTVDTVLNSDFLKTDTAARFATNENSFGSSSEAMDHFRTVASGQNDFYHATTSDQVGTLLTQGVMKVSGQDRAGALYFAEPNTILTKYATGEGTPIALKLTATPKITNQYLEMVNDIQTGRTPAFGPGFVKGTSDLPEGFYPGLRAAAGKSFGTHGLEEEYIVSQGTPLYLTSLRSVTSPSGEPWLLAEVSMSRPIIPDVLYGAARGIEALKNTRPYTGIPSVPKEAFDFGTEDATFAPNTPLETSIVKNMAPEGAPIIDLGYGVHEIASGSGMRLQYAVTAIREVVQDKGFPNPEQVTEAILQTEIDYGVKMYGSSGQKGAGIEQGIVTLNRSLNDIDVFVPKESGQPQTLSISDKVSGKIDNTISSVKGLFVKTPVEPAEEQMGPSFANDVTYAINKAAGQRVVEVDAEGTVTLTNGSGKLFDIHNENPSMEELLKQGSNPNKPESPYYGLGMKIEKYVRTEEGIDVMSYSEQVGRKLSGVSEFTVEPRTVVGKTYEGGPEAFSVTGRIAPRFEGRMKDIADFYMGEKGNIVLMGRSTNPITRISAARADALLEQWLDQWGTEPAANVRGNYLDAVRSGTDRYAIDLYGINKGRNGPEISSPFFGASINGMSASPSMPSPSGSAGITGSPAASGGIASIRSERSIADISPSDISAPSRSVSESSMVSPIISPIATSPYTSVSPGYSPSIKTSPSSPSPPPRDDYYPSQSISPGESRSPSQITSISPSPALSIYGKSPYGSSGYGSVGSGGGSGGGGSGGGGTTSITSNSIPSWERSHRRTKPARFLELFSFEEGTTSPVPTRFGLGGVNAKALAHNPKAAFIPGTRGFAGMLLRNEDTAPNGVLDILNKGPQRSKKPSRTTIGNDHL